MIVSYLNQFLSMISSKLLLLFLLIFCMYEAKSQINVEDSINEPVFFDLRKQYQPDTSNFFNADNAPSPDMIGKRKYVKPEFKVGKSMPLISIKKEESIEFKNETPETIK